MPLIGWALARALSLPPERLVGMVLVGAAPGGTASNVICSLARGDVALSISLSAASTLLAAALALKSFPVAAALPGVLFSVWHNLSGAMLAAWWSRRAVMSAMPRERED
ncbi:hypothetical protein [uncultured Thiocystis sp.]|uniref:hypothetical protein n=1 Tax=uncultured Thiocystis sp. TaxID=1202134 RepID=UPI00342373C6